MTVQANQAISDEVLTPQLKSTPITNGKAKPSETQQQKGITLSPEQLQVLVLQQLNQVNAKKDELTIAIKNLSDLATQLGQICAQQNKVIQEIKSKEN